MCDQCANSHVHSELVEGQDGIEVIFFGYLNSKVQIITQLGISLDNLSNPGHKRWISVSFVITYQYKLITNFIS